MAAFLKLYVRCKLSLEFSRRHSSLPLLHGTVAQRYVLAFNGGIKQKGFSFLYGDVSRCLRTREGNGSLRCMDIDFVSHALEP